MITIRGSTKALLTCVALVVGICLILIVMLILVGLIFGFDKVHSSTWLIDVNSGDVRKQLRILGCVVSDTVSTTEFSRRARVLLTPLDQPRWEWVITRSPGARGDHGRRVGSISECRDFMILLKLYDVRADDDHRSLFREFLQHSATNDARQFLMDLEGDLEHLRRQATCSQL